MSTGLRGLSVEYLLESAWFSPFFPRLFYLGGKFNYLIALSSVR